jgi:hypothetical protein
MATLEEQLADYEGQLATAKALIGRLDEEARAYLEEKQAERFTLVTSMHRLEGAMTALKVALNQPADGRVERQVAMREANAEKYAKAIAAEGARETI